MKIAKYRVWDKKEKKMYYLTAGSPFGTDYEVGIWDGGWELYKIAAEGKSVICGEEDGIRDDGVLMEFVGIKNGKEIYEGDIVCWNGAKGTGNNGSGDIVAWNDKSFGFGFKHQYGSKYFAKLSKSGFATFSTAVKVDVFGNIYQNPELLEKP